MKVLVKMIGKHRLFQASYRLVATEHNWTVNRENKQFGREIPTIYKAVACSLLEQ